MAQTYLKLLEDLRGQMDEDAQLVQIQHFMQDGAPPHYALIVREFLNDFFENWIERRGSVEWPARSCDITWCDFFLWSYLKDRVYARKLKTVPESRDIIEDEFDILRGQAAIISRTCRSVARWCHLCIYANDYQFENRM